MYQQLNFRSDKVTTLRAIQYNSKSYKDLLTDIAKYI